jgi:hypothetical protein
MITPLSIVEVVFGILVCFMGYSIFRSMLPLWGFILGGFALLFLAPLLIQVPPSQEILVQVVSFLIGGVIGALIATPLFYVTVFVSGAAMGALIGIVVGSYLQVSGGQVSVRALTELASMSFPPQIETATQVVFMVIFGLIIGGFSISFQKFMISASTAFLGAAGVVSGLTGPLLDMMRSNSSRGLWVMITWLVLGMVGLFIQFRMRDET